MQVYPMMGTPFAFENFVLQGFSQITPHGVFYRHKHLLLGCCQVGELWTFLCVCFVLGVTPAGLHVPHGVLGIKPQYGRKTPYLLYCCLGPGVLSFSCSYYSHLFLLKFLLFWKGVQPCPAPVKILTGLCFCVSTGVQHSCFGASLGWRYSEVLQFTFIPRSTTGDQGNSSRS